MPTTKRRLQCRRTSKLQPNQHGPAPSREIELALMGANRVHDALCAPPVQRIGQFEVASAVIPAHLVSGDFVLSFEVEDAEFLVLGDLMGKGLSAAMWLTHVVELIRRVCEREETLPAIMARLNCEMYRSRVGVPLTSLFIAKLEPVQSRVTYSCAGCPAAFLLASDHQVIMLEHGGPVLGALEPAAYHAETIYVAPGQVLLAVSDGISEIHRGSHFELRPDRVVDHLRYSAGDTAESLVGSLVTRVRNTSSALIDDLSVMAIRRAG